MGRLSSRFCYFHSYFRFSSPYQIRKHCQIVFERFISTTIVIQIPYHFCPPIFRWTGCCQFQLRLEYTKILQGENAQNNFILVFCKHVTIQGNFIFVKYHCIGFVLKNEIYVCILIMQPELNGKFNGTIQNVTFV